MKRPRLVWLFAASLAIPLLAGMAVRSLAGGSPPPPGAGSPAGPYRGSEPPPGIEAPEFTLKSYRGRVVRMQALRGKVVLVTFLDTDCRTKCPIIATAVAAGVRLLSPAERQHVTALALTVDPASDDRRSVRSFLKRRHALAELDFLLGSVRQMRPVWRSFLIVAAAETGNSDIHSADVRVFDRRGIWVSTLHAGVDLTPSNLAHDVAVALG